MWMKDRLSVDRAAITMSAVKAQGHGDDLAVSHRSTEGRVSAASGGWTGRSAQALAAWAATAVAVSDGIVSRIGAHSQPMRSAACRRGLGRVGELKARSEVCRSLRFFGAM
jgi:hypothetical protein